MTSQTEALNAALIDMHIPIKGDYKQIHKEFSEKATFKTLINLGWTEERALRATKRSSGPPRKRVQYCLIHL